jgi:glycosyltransferase involved in cell wall biosynthesis
MEPAVQARTGRAARPRVLFVTPAAFNHLTGGGVTFSNLFADWPQDRLATVHNDAVPTTEDVCNRYYVLGRDEIDLVPPLGLARSWRDDDAGVGAGAAIPVAASQGGGLIGRIQGDSAPQLARLSEALEQWITAFRPDLMFTLLGTNAIMSLVSQIRRRFNLPMVVHLMDDWPRVQYQRGLFAPLERARMHRLLADNLENAVATLGIGDAMCRTFSERYGHRFVAFQNCVDVARWSGSVRTDGAPRNKPLSVLYFGSVFANAQLQSLVDLCHAVVRLNASGMPVRLSISSPNFCIEPHRERLLIDPAAIDLIPPTEDDAAFFGALSAADALVLPVNFDADSVAFIRYSMPTKVPAYLASGTPVLVYGPRGVAQVDYAAEYGWGEVVSDRDPSALDAGLRRVLEDASLREQLRQRAQAIAAERHDAAMVRTAFQNLLTRIAPAAA